MLMFKFIGEGLFKINTYRCLYYPVSFFYQIIYAPKIRFHKCIYNQVCRYYSKINNTILFNSESKIGEMYLYYKLVIIF